MRFFSVAMIALLFVFSAKADPLIYEAKEKGISLSEKDQEVLSIGEISDTSYIVGGVLGTYPIGFGIGHVIQGRWSEQGWIFTAGEAASLGAILAGVSGCIRDSDFDTDHCSGFNSTLIIGGLLGFVGFRVWEIVDVWATPPSQNRKYKELKKFIQGEKTKDVKTSLDLIPLFDPYMGNGLALNLRF
jgi:hypothetical protein